MSFPHFRIRDIFLRNRVVLAPMDGISDLPFRLLCRMGGAGLCYTEMIPSYALLIGNREALRKIEMHPQDKPIAVQIVGNEPEVMAQASVTAEEKGADIIDINAGCPSRRTMANGSGARLLEDLPRLEKILERVRCRIKIPLTLKVRIGPTVAKCVLNHIARMVLDIGLDAVTIHARATNQGLGGRVWLEMIRAFKEMVGDLTVIGNGGVKSPEDAEKMMKETLCDAVMIGRGALKNPWLFSEITAYLVNRKPTQIPSLRTIIETHLNLMLTTYGDEELVMKLIRKYLVCYLRGIPNASFFRNSLRNLKRIKDLQGFMVEIK